MAYDLGFYGELLTCAPRTPAYVEALRRSVTPDSVVIDLGAGPGFFALLALHLGARSVVAIEPHASVEILRGLAEAQGFAERLTIIRDVSTAYRPAEKADIVIADLRGVLPLFQSFVESISDARKRLLADNGIFLPARDILNIALVEDSAAYAHFTGPWVKDFHGIDLSGLRAAGLNDHRKVTLEPSALISEPQVLAVLDYRKIERPNLSASASLRASRNATAHGFAVWFDAEMGIDGLSFSNSPRCPPQVYGQMFFPFEQPIEISAQSEINIDLGAAFAEDGYVWSWVSRFESPGRPAIRYRQSTFLGTIPDPDRLRRQGPDHVPKLVRQPVDAFLLSLFDGQRSLGEMAAEVMNRFPEAFRDLADALRHVARLSARYEDRTR